jgi:hypothetical protein
MTAEYAKNPHRAERDIEDVPAFQRHLRRNGLRSAQELEARNRRADTSAAHEADALTLKARYVRMKGGRR